MCHPIPHTRIKLDVSVLFYLNDTFFRSVRHIFWVRTKDTVIKSEILPPTYIRATATRCRYGYSEIRKLLVGVKGCIGYLSSILHSLHRVVVGRTVTHKTTFSSQTMHVVILSQNGEGSRGR